MTRFLREISGEMGAYWEESARREVAEMQARADAGEIMTDEDGAAYWKRSGNYLPEDCAEKLFFTDFQFSLKATDAAREKQTAEFLDGYRKRQANRRLSEEDRYEMQCAFGKGSTVVDIITGQTFRV